MANPTTPTTPPPNSPEPRRGLRDRPTSDLLVLLVAGTICASVLTFGGALVLDGFVNPGTDHAAAIAVVGDTIQMLVGLLAGFIAGRTEPKAKP